MEGVKKIHFVGVGGVGTGTLAKALVSGGYEVSGSDGALYDPMKSVLEQANVKLLHGFEASHVEKTKPDLVVIGNVVRKENPEAQAWIRSGIPFVSFPEAVRRFLIGNKKSIVCSGTHGKSTTTSWVSFMLKEVGLDPSYLIGGVPHNLDQGSFLSEGKYFVGEGDEYDSAFFDKGPKFLHYSPDCLIISSIEFDHADIYRDLEHVKSSFVKLVSLLPGDGVCVGRFEDPVVMEVLTDALCPVQTFGLHSASMWKLGQVEENSDGYKFEVLYKGKSLGDFQTPLFGEFNLMNLLSGIVVGVNLGVNIEKIRPAVAKFQGIRRRQQTLLKTPIKVVDDFAHHPTEVKATLTAVRSRFPKGKLWALFEPRSATARRKAHQKAYVEAFDSADHILISLPYRGNELSKEERFSPEELVEDLKSRQKQALVGENPQEILEYFLHNYSEGDIVVVMSNGEFDKIQEKIVKAVS